MRYHSMVPVYAVVLYGILIAGGQYAMKNRLPWNWRGLMALWNLSLSVFSWIGMFRTLPSLLHNFYYMSIRDNFCIDRTFFLFGLSRLRQKKTQDLDYPISSTLFLFFNHLIHFKSSSLFS